MSEPHKIVIVGMGAAGFYAAKSALAANKDAEVTIVDGKDFEMFSPCGMPFVLEGEVKCFDDLIHAVPEQSKRFVKLLGHQVAGIDVQKKQAILKDVRNGAQKTLDWNSLIMATGSKPIVPPIPGARELLGKGVFTIDSLANAKSADAWAREAKSAVVVGAGAIGLEVAMAFKERGLAVTLVEKLTHPLPKSLDEDMGDIMKEHISSEGIRAMFGVSLDRINGSSRVEAVEAGSEKIPADMVIMAIGVKAKTDIIQGTPILAGDFGIITDERMETNMKGVYAAGDCAQNRHFITGAPFNAMLATTAYREGTVAGANAAGGNAKYSGSLGTFGAVIGKFEAASTGLTAAAAKAAGMNAAVGKGRGRTKPSWMQGGAEIAVKLVFDASSGKILGGQAIGRAGAASRINVISSAIRAGMTVRQLNDVELAYCPKISEMYDALNVAADVALKKLK